MTEGTAFRPGDIEKETVMKKLALAVSAAISLFAASGVAHAGEVISDQRYWPNEAVSDQRYAPSGAYGYYYADRTRPGFYAPGYDAMASMDQVPAIGPVTGSSFVYRGGPKTGTRDYTRIEIREPLKEPGARLNSASRALSLARLYATRTASAPLTASALSITARSSAPDCTVMFSAKKRASVT